MIDKNRYTIVNSVNYHMPRIEICKCDSNKTNDINICKDLHCGYSLIEAKNEIIKRLAYLINRIHECENLDDINNVLK